MVPGVSEHNSGNTFHTNKYKPWELIIFLGFKSKQSAINFEKYLKTGSGNAFLTKRLLK